MAWPTTDDPRTEFVTVRFTVSEAAEIDWLKAQIGGRNRSATVRDAVGRIIAVEKRRAAKIKKMSAPGGRMLDEDDTQDG